MATLSSLPPEIIHNIATKLIEDDGSTAFATGDRLRHTDRWQVHDPCRGCYACRREHALRLTRLALVCRRVALAIGQLTRPVVCLEADNAAAISHCLQKATQDPFLAGRIRRLVVTDEPVCEIDPADLRFLSALYFTGSVEMACQDRRERALEGLAEFVGLCTGLESLSLHAPRQEAALLAAHPQAFARLTSFEVWIDTSSPFVFDTQTIIRLVARMPNLKSLALSSLTILGADEVSFLECPFSLDKLVIGETSWSTQTAVHPMVLAWLFGGERGKATPHLYLDLGGRTDKSDAWWQGWRHCLAPIATRLRRLTLRGVETTLDAARKHKDSKLACARLARLPEPGRPRRPYVARPLHLVKLAPSETVVVHLAGLFGSLPFDHLEFVGVQAGLLYEKEESWQPWPTQSSEYVSFRPFVLPGHPRTRVEFGIRALGFPSPWWLEQSLPRMLALQYR